MPAVWTVGSDQGLTFPRLEASLEVDVAIIGGGITGMATALNLVEAGQRVAVLEAHRIGGGCTGGSTGNLYATFAQGVQHISQKWGADTARRVVAVRARAVDEIENTVRRFDINCGFARRPLYFCVAPNSGDKDEFIAAEWRESANAGLPAQLVDSIGSLPIPLERAVFIDNQAQFNPLQYVQALARIIADQGAGIFEHSRAIEIDAGKHRVLTEHGRVTAKHIVQATHTPKGINLVQAEMEVYREHGVAAPLPPGIDIPQGIFWMLDEFHSVRSYQHNGQDFLVVVGEKHSTGHDQLGRDYLENLKNYGRRYFPVTDFPYEWSAQQYRAADLLPYIGRSGSNHVYIATGFAADGLVWGQAAASIIRDQILDRASDVDALFNPRRFTPMKSARHWGETNMKVGKHLLTDRFKLEKLADVDAVKTGEGKVVSVDGESVAVYRRPDNSLSLLSPVCPHMKCLVSWNAADTSWDCPCHGSRFDTEGNVIEGPAFEPLRRIDKLEAEKVESWHPGTKPKEGERPGVR